MLSFKICCSFERTKAMIHDILLPFKTSFSSCEHPSVVSDSLQLFVSYTVHGILQARILEWVAFSLLQGIELGSLALQRDSLAFKKFLFTQRKNILLLLKERIYGNEYSLFSYLIIAVPYLCQFPVFGNSKVFNIDSCSSMK